MRRHAVGLVVAMVMLTAVTTVTGVGEGESVNKNKSSSSAGLFWSTEKDESDLMRKAEPDHDDDSSAALVNDHDDIDGGFSSLDGMLQWAIGIHHSLFLSPYFSNSCIINSFVMKPGHSDPAKLKEAAQDVRRLSPTELQKRQMEIKVKNVFFRAHLVFNNKIRPLSFSFLLV